MGWSFRFARVFGIDLKVHATFALILVLGAVQWGVPHGLPGAIFGVFLMLALFACVLLHELGHSLAARTFGVPTKEIVMLPIGGVALLARMPKNPVQELVIAAAGPLVNVGIAVLLAVVAGATLAPQIDAETLFGAAGTPSPQAFVLWLLMANVSLVLFNLIPAFPLDGGRMLRAALAFRMGHARATRTAASIGQALAVALGLVGIFSGNLVLAFIALFIFLGAGSENLQVQTGNVLARMSAGEVYNRHALALGPADTVGHAAEYILTSYQPDYAVLDGTEFLGLVTRDDVLRALMAGRAGTAVSWIMQRDVVHVDSATSLADVRQALAERGKRVAAVDGDGRFLGLVSLEDIAETMLLIPHLRRGGPDNMGRQAVI